MLLNSDAEDPMKSRQSTSQKAYLHALFTTILALVPINARAANVSDGFACAEAKPIGSDGTVPVVMGPRLLALFPEISSVLDTSAFRVSNKWMGLSPYSPAKFEVALALDGDRFEGEGSLSYGGQGRDSPQVTKRNVAVPRDAVRAFLCAALHAPLEERAYEPYIAHTDDYPDLRFTFQGQGGPMTILTRSQSHTVQSQLVQTPWAINYADRSFVVSAPDIDTALDQLLASLDIRLFPEK
jgi:hypothetical protein